MTHLLSYECFHCLKDLISDFIFIILYTFFLNKYIFFGRLFRIPAHAELFGLFHLFTLFLEEFDYTARVQHVLHTTGCSWVAVVLDNISLSRLIRVFF